MWRLLQLATASGIMAIGVPSHSLVPHLSAHYLVPHLSMHSSVSHLSSLSMSGATERNAAGGSGVVSDEPEVVPFVFLRAVLSIYYIFVPASMPKTRV